ncbi:DUF6116 family protein [Microbulbifer sp. SAOS-129_SWC]|uniref:DUF6116 family protein n=1 Tax=Microbulbifer sp. SAOS-129_SWC TaxID=3145235 RepID=UPI00321724D1
MKKALPSALVGWFLNYATKLEHPLLFKWISVIFLVNLFIPDPVPFVDELLLGLFTLYLGRRKKAPPPREWAAADRGGDTETNSREKRKL